LRSFLAFLFSCCCFKRVFVFLVFVSHVPSLCSSLSSRPGWCVACVRGPLLS
jgi:hypothetical protein